MDPCSDDSLVNHLDRLFRDHAASNARLLRAFDVAEYWNDRCLKLKSEVLRLKGDETEKRHELLVSKLDHADRERKHAETECEKADQLAWPLKDALDKIASSKEMKAISVRIPARDCESLESFLKVLMEKAVQLPEKAKSRLVRICREAYGIPDGDKIECSPDFRSVAWHGEKFCFTANQALVVEVLVANFRKGTPDVGDETLLQAIDRESPPERLLLVFRNSSAWGSLIVQGATKGTHRIKPPTSP